MANNELKRLIPKKSWDAYVGGYENLEEVLCALIVDPEAAADAAEDLWTDLPHRMRDFRDQGELLNQGPMAMDRLLEGIAAWIRTTSSTMWMQQIGSYNRLLGVWCASYVIWKKAIEIKPGNIRLARSAAKSFADAVEACVRKGIDTDVVKDSRDYTRIMDKARNRAVDYDIWVRDESALAPATGLRDRSRDFSRVLSDMSKASAMINHCGNMLVGAISATQWATAARKVEELAQKRSMSQLEQNTEYDRIGAIEGESLKILAAKACLRFPH